MNHPYTVYRPNTRHCADEFEAPLRAEAPAPRDWWEIVGLLIVVVSGGTTLYLAVVVAAWWAR